MKAENSCSFLAEYVQKNVPRNTAIKEPKD